MQYHIVISQEQRDVLIAIDPNFTNHFADEKITIWGSYEYHISEQSRAELLSILESSNQGASYDLDDPLCYWQSMLRVLPVDEAEHPGVLHGLCL